ncbi:MAG: hypothetical protein A2W91_09845 [Bacteroidetes bacterium GWF2_38_335]|nr:MAG: hypothetical protein A2W91_09845 [Bacteroidetes bacterium GWF2_38_335]
MVIITVFLFTVSFAQTAESPNYSLHARTGVKYIKKYESTNYSFIGPVTDIIFTRKNGLHFGIGLQSFKSEYAESSYSNDKGKNTEIGLNFEVLFSPLNNEPFKIKPLIGFSFEPYINKYKYFKDGLNYWDLQRKYFQAEINIVFGANFEISKKLFISLIVPCELIYYSDFYYYANPSIQYENEDGRFTISPFFGIGFKIY